MVEQPQNGHQTTNMRNESFQKRLIAYCFDNLRHFHKTKEIKMCPEDFNAVKAPLFVTWMKDGDLRGCIGTFAEDGKLGETLAQYSLIAAVRDTRFDPISESEVPSLSCEISILSNFEEIQDPLDW